MGVAAYHRGSLVIERHIQEAWEPHFRRQQQIEDCKAAEAAERTARLALDLLWRYEERVLPVLSPHQRMTVRERQAWVRLKAEFFAARRGAPPLAQRGIARRITMWAKAVLGRWVRLCARRVPGDPRLVEIAGVAVWPEEVYWPSAMSGEQPW